MDCKGCSYGIEACKSIPGWPSPEQAEKMLDAGLAKRMSLDWWESDGNLPHINILAPAAAGHEGRRAGSWSRGRCVFLTPESLCELHDSGYKPEECAKMCCKKESKVDQHKRVAIMWNTPEGMALVERWKKK